MQERSVTVILLYPASTGAANGTEIEDIRRLYRETFSQESVPRADDSAVPCVSF